MWPLNKITGAARGVCFDGLGKLSFFQEDYKGRPGKNNQLPTFQKIYLNPNEDLFKITVFMYKFQLFFNVYFR